MGKRIVASIKQISLSSFELFGCDYVRFYRQTQCKNIQNKHHDDDTAAKLEIQIIVMAISSRDWTKSLLWNHVNVHTDDTHSLVWFEISCVNDKKGSQTHKKSLI